MLSVDIGDGERNVGHREGILKECRGAHKCVVFD